MPRNDRTFTYSDVVRIFEQNLEDFEQERVIDYFLNRYCDPPEVSAPPRLPEFPPEMSSIVLASVTLYQSLVTTGNLGVVEALSANAQDLLEPLIFSEMYTQYNDLFNELVGLRVAIQDYIDSLPDIIIEPLAESLFEPLRQQLLLIEGIAAPITFLDDLHAYLGVARNTSRSADTQLRTLLQFLANANLVEYDASTNSYRRLI